MNYKDRKFSQSIYLTHPFLLSSGPFTNEGQAGGGGGGGGEAGVEGEDVAQLRVIHEAPTMDNGASSIRLQPAECYVAFHIATSEYAHNTGSNLCI